MNRKLREDYLKTYNTIMFTQTFPNKNWVSCGWAQVYMDGEPTGNWEAIYSTSSAYHICPFSGSFKDCIDCGAFDPDFSIDFCYNQKQIINTKELIGRIMDCERAGVKVEYFD